MKVPEIGDEQTIEILKPEVFIGEVPEPEPTGSEPSPAEPAARPVPQKQKPESPIEGLLEEARKSLAESNLPASMESYGKLIKKKKQLPEVLEDLQKATLDHPLEIILFKTLGDAYMQSDLLDEALEAYSKAEDLLA